jgi:hypothetical protein
MPDVRKPRKHFIRDRKTEIVLGLVLFVVGSFLLWDAFDGRGKNMPWPASTVLPW